MDSPDMRKRVLRRTQKKVRALVFEALSSPMKPVTRCQKDVHRPQQDSPGERQRKRKKVQREFSHSPSRPSLEGAGKTPMTSRRTQCPKAARRHRLDHRCHPASLAQVSCPSPGQGLSAVARLRPHDTSPSKAADLEARISDLPHQLPVPHLLRLESREQAIHSAEQLRPCQSAAYKIDMGWQFCQDSFHMQGNPTRVPALHHQIRVVPQATCKLQDARGEIGHRLPRIVGFSATTPPLRRGASVKDRAPLLLRQQHEGGETAPLTATVAPLSFRQCLVVAAVAAVQPCHHHHAPTQPSSRLSSHHPPCQASSTRAPQAQWRKEAVLVLVGEQQQQQQQRLNTPPQSSPTAWMPRLEPPRALPLAVRTTSRASFDEA
mmetsp:Transcript_52226/g.113757  ORF Transcript_52226/g.113757 Transcript_52226/m.113757 type:complete len:377 (+) Transcript_52226:383-1513(+)